jgi:pilus assembly protein CpaF
VTADLVERVRSRLANSGTEITTAVVADAVRREAGGVVGDADVLDALRLLEQEFVGAGVLQPLLRDPATTDVLVTGTEVWVDGAGGLRRAGIRFADEDAVRRLAQRLALMCGRRIDDAQPFVDAWLPDTGPHDRVRLHAVLAPIAADGTCVSLRALRPAGHDLNSLESLGTFDAPTRQVLESIVDARLAFLISGGTGSGKTTLLSALLGRVPASERIVCVEDATERLRAPSNIESTRENAGLHDHLSVCVAVWVGPRRAGL